MKTIKTLCSSVKAKPSFFAILLMCFAGFAFADGHLEGEEAIHQDKGAETDEEESGRSLEYTVGSFNQYKAGEKVGNQSNLMWGQAAGLSETDINDLAEYIESL